MIKTTKTYICDLCKRESQNSDFNDGLECGCFHVTVTGHLGGRSFQGDWGGTNFDNKYLLCHKCAKDFIKWVRVKNDMNNKDLKKGDFFKIKHEGNSHWQPWSGPHEVEEIKNGCVFYIRDGKTCYRRIEDCFRYDV